MEKIALIGHGIDVHGVAARIAEHGNEVVVISPNKLTQENTIPIKNIYLPTMIETPKETRKERRARERKQKKNATKS